MTVQEIKQQIDRLSDSEYCELMAMLSPQEEDAWDRQIEQDARSGRLDFLMEEVDADIRDGRVADMPE